MSSKKDLKTLLLEMNKLQEKVKEEEEKVTKKLGKHLLNKLKVTNVKELDEYLSNQENKIKELSEILEKERNAFNDLTKCYKRLEELHDNLKNEYVNLKTEYESLKAKMLTVNQVNNSLNRQLPNTHQGY